MGLHVVFDFEAVLGQVNKTTLRLKKITQKSTAFVFINTYFDQTFTKCLSN